MRLIYKALSEKVINAGIKVHKNWSCGFVEKVYENSLVIMLEEMDIPFTQQQVIRLYYYGRLFVEYIADLGLSEAAFYEHSEPTSDPKERARFEQLDGLITRTIQRAESAPNYMELRDRGEQLRQRLHKTGAQREPIILVLGKK